MAKDDPEQETRNDDPLVQNQREQRASGERDQAEGERDTTEDAEPRGDRKHDARGPRRPGGGRKGQPKSEGAAKDHA